MLSYKNQYNNEMKLQLDILNKAYDNVKNTLTNKFTLKIK